MASALCRYHWDRRFHMVFSEGLQECKQSIQVRLREPSEFLGDEFALAHLLSTPNFTAFPRRQNT
ncbi:MAG TPA: hypothetical protein VNY05_00820, partial [Candidatus Acidoferrales bacterium]|nr:hypothetical protein [Candidatus Acidoferrales bacterium]